MTDHIIKAAREAGIEFQQHRGITGRVNTMTCGSQHIDALERFYAIARNEALEDAEKRVVRFGMTLEYDNSDCFAEEIRALKEQPK